MKHLSNCVNSLKETRIWTRATHCNKYRISVKLNLLRVCLCIFLYRLFNMILEDLWSWMGKKETFHLHFWDNIMFLSNNFFLFILNSFFEIGISNKCCSFFHFKLFFEGCECYTDIGYCNIFLFHFIFYMGVCLRERERN